MKQIFNHAIELLENKECFALATIMVESGSTPRSKGAKMLIKADGNIIETVGGGAIEAQCISEALSVISEKKSKIFKFNLTNHDAAVSEMICGGSGEILITYFDAENTSNLKIFKSIINAINKREKAYLVYPLHGEKASPFYLNFEDETQENPIEIEIKSIISKASINEPRLIDYKGNLFFIDPLVHGGTVYLFGGGHVSKETATVLNLINFETIVIDDRADFANRERFPNSKIIVVESLDHLPPLAVDANSYIVIMTRGHLYDRNVLEWALKTKACYIGMIGSRRKIKMTFEKLMASGFTQENLEKVHAPIGIKLAAQTPSEIAVSIVAELINVRSEK
ncbi:MAG: XdhC family aldehyde oxidoreductase maturation factor [Eubacteriaceae bacterium]